MAVQIQLRNDTAANWTAANPILAQGEMGLETDTDLFKIGNGLSNWADLPYGGLAGTSGIANAIAPIVYDELTQSVSLDYDQLVIDGGTA
jgi:hypothetical protein